MKSAPPRSVAQEAVLTARQHAWLTVAFLILIGYGSLVPFHFRSLPLSEAVLRFHEVCSQSLWPESRTDLIVNVLLFIPLSYVWMAALSVDQSRTAGLLAARLVLPCCALFSATMEFSQLFFPPRVCSLSDVAAESLGGFLGATLWLWGGQGITAWGRQMWGNFGKRGAVARLLTAYLVRPPLRRSMLLGWLGLVVIIKCQPFDFTAAPAVLARPLSRTALVPFADYQKRNYLSSFGHMVGNTLLFLPVGALLASPNSSPKRGLAEVQVVAVAFTVAAGLEVSRLCLPKHHLGITNILIASFGAWLGFVVASRAWDNRMAPCVAGGSEADGGKDPTSRIATPPCTPMGSEYATN